MGAADVAAGGDVASSILTVDDLAPFATISEAKAQAMVTHVTAVAVRHAPCLKTTTDEDILGAARAILLDAVLRWNDAGSGAVQSQAAGPFSQTLDTRQERRGMFTTAEVSALQSLCSTSLGAAYTVSLAGA